MWRSHEKNLGQKVNVKFFTTCYVDRWERVDYRKGISILRILEIPIEGALHRKFKAKKENVASAHDCLRFGPFL